MSSRLHAARFDEALQAWQVFTAWWGAWLPVRLGSWRPDEMIWRQGPHSDLPALVRWLDENYDDEILLGLPMERKRAGGVGRASVCWARVEGSDQLARARRFRPLPSLVLQEGASSRRWLFWPLERAESYFAVEPANRKLAYHLHGVQRHGDPDSLWMAAPGTCLRIDRARPVPVRVARLTTATYSLAQVTGRLKDPPPRDAWLQGARA